MKKIDPTVLRETLYIFAFSFICSLLMESVFLIIGKWDLAVLIGNLVGLFAAVGNFFLMGLSVQAALGKEEKDAKNHMKLSQSLRLLGLLAVVAAAYAVSKYVTFIEINILALVIPYLFPRIAVAFRPFFNKKVGGDSSE